MKALNIIAHMMLLLSIVSSLCVEQYNTVAWQFLAWLCYWQYTDILKHVTKLMKELSASRKELKEPKEKEEK